jgi:SAM-dependent methyltransferase
MSLTDIPNRTFFANRALDDELPLVNEVFWSALIEHIERDCNVSPRVILDVGCHSGGLLHTLFRRFMPEQMFGIEPLAAARSAASSLLATVAANATLLDSSAWNQIPTGVVDLITSHEVLYLEPDVRDFMSRIHRVIAANGVAYIVLGCHAENPLWGRWKASLVTAGHTVYDHRPLEIMEAAWASGLLASVLPLRRSGWITYNPLEAEFPYPDLQTMLDHHYRNKLIFRLRVANARTIAS